ncbi:hypothetical protein BGZ83_000982 [Gryganskiella cystojenkinii]|nr:hypothetical protein BGZ83_000982 [Gryganskiella cystojenkinii]
MVKITFSLLSIAAVVASVVAASSCAQETFQGFESDYSADNKCLPSDSVKEYETFTLKSVNLRTVVSKNDDNILVGGVAGNNLFQELELCVVSTDAECNPPYPTNCIYENVEYRFRVNHPIKGYLRVVDDEVVIVPNFSQASGLNLHQISGWYLRVGYKHNGLLQVFSAPRAGNPIVVEEAAFNRQAQYMEIKKSSYRKGGRFYFW